MRPSRVLIVVSEPSRRTSLAWGELTNKLLNLLMNLRNPFSLPAQSSNLRLGCDFTNTKKFPLNRATQRNLAKNISRVYHTISNPSNLKEPLVELHKYMARPPGCSFLGATTAHVPVTVNSPTENLSDIIIDSGSDITLISMNTLNTLVEVPKIKKGQKINLVQVTGKVSISGYVELDLYFRMSSKSDKFWEGPEIQTIGWTDVISIQRKLCNKRGLMQC